MQVTIRVHIRKANMRYLSRVPEIQSTQSAVEAPITCKNSAQLIKQIYAWRKR